MVKLCMVLSRLKKSRRRMELLALPGTCMPPFRSWEMLDWLVRLHTYSYNIMQRLNQSHTAGLMQAFCWLC
jgi:hypothetical protein